MRLWVQLEMNWLSERQAVHRERLVEQKLELQLQAHAHLVATKDAAMITQVRAPAQGTHKHAR